MSYKKMEPHPGYKKASKKQCRDHTKPVSKWNLSRVMLVWCRILKCTVCGFETEEWKELEPPEGA